MIAKFIGMDSSGFKNGYIYKLDSEIKKIYNALYVFLYDKHSDAWCSYKNLNSILSNWEIIGE